MDGEPANGVGVGGLLFGSKHSPLEVLLRSLGGGGGLSNSNTTHTQTTSGLGPSASAGTCSTECPSCGSAECPSCVRGSCDAFADILLKQQHSDPDGVLAGVIDSMRSRCAVCMAALDPGCPDGFGLACGHRFHAPCVSRWLDQHGSCPTCGRIVAGITRVVLGQQLLDASGRVGKSVCGSTSCRARGGLAGGGCGCCRSGHPFPGGAQQAPQAQQAQQQDQLAAGSRWMLNAALWIALVVACLTFSDMMR